MLDWKIKQEKIGKTFPGGLHDVMKDPQCNENWKVKFQILNIFYIFYKKNCLM